MRARLVSVGLVGIALQYDHALKRLKESLRDDGSSSGAGSSGTVKSDSGVKGERVFANNVKVLVHGLKSDKALQYNFQTARVICYDATTQRYTVTIIEGKFEGVQLGALASNLLRQ